MKNFSLILLIVLPCFSVAQSNTISAGGEASGTGGSSSYSIGQIDYRALANSNGNINEGVQQPYELFITGIYSSEEDALDISVYPNPTNSFLHLRSEEITFEGISYSLVDISGNVIGHGELNESLTSIDITSISTGQYILNVMSGESMLKSFKIIKN